MGMARFFYAVDEDKLNFFIANSYGADDEAGERFLKKYGQDKIDFSLREYDALAGVIDLDPSFEMELNISVMGGGFYSVEQVKQISDYFDSEFTDNEKLKERYIRGEGDINPESVVYFRNFFKSASEKNLAIATYCA